MQKQWLLTGAAAAILTLSGCAMLAPSDGSGALDLTIIHMNDHHSRLFPNSGTDLMLDGERTRVEIGGFPRAVSLIKTLEAQAEHSVKVHAGDAITGDLYYTLFKGEADAAMMNEACFDVFTLGNHEFDDGDAGLANFLGYLNEGDCNTSVISANVVPEVGVSPLTPNSQWDSFDPYVIKSFGSAKVGFIGIDIANKTKNSSKPDATTVFLDEVETAQRYIDELTAMGIDKIVLVTHYQYENDIAMARQLRGVDAIIGGDSHTLLGDDFAQYGLSPAGPYPTVVSDATGNTVCIAQAWEYSLIVGELQVSWDDNGNVASCGGNPHLPLGDTFLRRNSEGQRVPVGEDTLNQILAEISASPVLMQVTPDAQAADILSTYTAQVDVLKQDVIGRSTDNLCLVRIPGESRSNICAPSETAQYGSDISNLVALAFKEMSLESDIAIQNGGGVRIDVPAGDLTVGLAYQLLPFANTLVNLEMTGAEIKAVLEDALDFALQPGGSTGAYPYASGLRFHVDATQPKGQRVSQLQVKLKDATQWSAINMNRTYTVVTNDFIARGQDGYLTFGEIYRDGRVTNTYLDYAQSFVDYVRSVGTVTRLPYSEYSTQSFRQ
ncbi:bifunctional metallophosphatase/5'-nucleotidase [Salinispirillum marinum]|uniref:Bifunctional metallophosphatase/5'-nucleotidase n=2 Tax=Saccharospirillaceae TaxID=255527 RepID=A0ABV8BKD0_9GAMM